MKNPLTNPALRTVLSETVLSIYTVLSLIELSYRPTLSNAGIILQHIEDNKPASIFFFYFFISKTDRQNLFKLF